ncbi:MULTISPECIES: 2-hydroxymuconate tautomerase family protein [Bacillaceae]|uniref:2-hydroxymuconate tautomerase family protein n=1 Tax=Bacillaceae TaxID=186817 RepID=UPI000BA7CB40|nr:MULTISPECIES: 2-hydroxymuconate tautomerase family protein [Bacillaceae]PAE26593.1 4-oxalocrotonate tautomerase [Bacillus sp. 7894-2]URM31490.1 2-hydroxymuconate tautomerase family protein [Cytobacillus firmus]
MPIIQVHLLDGRSDSQLKELISSLTEAAVGSLEVNPNQVRVIIQPVPKTHWGVGGITKAELEDSKNIQNQ